MSARRARSARSSAPTASSGPPTSRTTTPSIPAWSTSCASTTATCPTTRARGLFGLNALDMYGLPQPVMSEPVLDLLVTRRHRRRRHRRARAHRRRRGARRARSSAVGAIDDDGDGRRSTPTGCSSRPGFVDIHTHYDAQLHWDPTASPASWHGVTTLLTGNCGFTLAPSKPDDLPWLLQMLSPRRGDVGRRARRPASTSRGGSLGDFLANLDGRIGVNVGANVGHCAVRRYVMGDDASERTATDDEIAAMQRARAGRHARGCDRVHVVAARPARRPRRPRRAVEPRRARGAHRARAACSASSDEDRSSSSRARSSTATTTTIGP